MRRSTWVTPAVLAAAMLAGPAQATQLCAWLVEKPDSDGFHQFDLHLQADSEADIYYMLKGDGVTGEDYHAYSPGTGTYTLHAGRDEKVWGFGSTVRGPAEIDILAEVHAYPKDVFDKAEPPLLASFPYKRHVPEDEAAVPRGFGAKRCVDIPADKLKAPER